MSQLQSYIRRYGEVAGPKLYHAVRSRSAYMGANARRRATIARLTDEVPTVPRPTSSARRGESGLLPFALDGDLSMTDAG